MDVAITTGIFSIIAALLSALITKYGLPNPFKIKTAKFHGKSIPIYIINDNGLIDENKNSVTNQVFNQVTVRFIGSNCYAKGSYSIKKGGETIFSGTFKAKGKNDRDWSYMIYSVEDKNSKKMFYGTMAVKFKGWDKDIGFYITRSDINEGKSVFGKFDIDRDN